jgi:NAD(P)-dependent dehydrogenase (short-subunit alcohol dehydrogenase family)
MTNDLEGRTVIITGGGQGLGRAYALAFGEAGAQVAIAELNADRGDEVAGEVEAAGGTAMAMPTDVGDPQSVEDMVAAAKDKFGRIDVLINNAAIFTAIKMKGFDEISFEEWENVIRVNLTGSYWCGRTVAPHMRENQWGRIINVSSATVTMGRPNYLHYVTSKAGLIGLTRSLAREVGKDGITVNTVLPGATYTEIPRETVTEEQKQAIVGMQCIQRPEEPKDLVGVMMFLASDASGFVTGQSITVDGGLTHL